MRLLRRRDHAHVMRDTRTTPTTTLLPNLLAVPPRRMPVIWQPITRDEARAQPCPWCHSRAGKPCRDQHGAEIITCHSKRYDAAKMARRRALAAGAFRSD